MSAEELEFEYITIKSVYEQKKSILRLLLITMVLAILTNAGNDFRMFMEKAFQYASGMENAGMEVQKVSFIMASIVTLFVVIVCFTFLYIYVNELGEVRKKVMVVEMVRNSQKDA